MSVNTYDKTTGQLTSIGGVPALKLTALTKNQTSNIEQIHTASKDYAVGDFFTYSIDNRLYKVIAPIEQGDELRENVNMIKTSLADELATGVPSGLKDIIADSPEDGPTAESVHSKGEYVLYIDENGNSKFGKADEPIAIGDTISEHVTDTTIGRELSSGGSIVDVVYPVGSIYITTDSTDPSTRFAGTTWELWGEGKTIIGVDANDEDFDTVEATGGEKAHVLTESELAQHTHTFVGTANQKVSATNLNHRHYNSFNSGGAGSHDHGPSVGASNGFALFNTTGDTQGTGVGFAGGGTNYYWTLYCLRSDNPGNHVHSVAGWSTYVNNTAASAAWNHDHTITPTGTNSDSGSSEAHNNLPPYITCYMWKRTS